MDVLTKNMLSKGLQIAKYEMREYWLDIGRIEDYEKAHEIYNKHFKTNKST